MEYEHKYKAAFKIASELYKEGTINETLIKVFPELIGLEDERIKREVIKEITFYVRDCDEKEKMLNWLEKQGEKSFGYNNNKIQQKDFTPSIKPKFKAGDKVIGIFSGMRHCILEVHNDHYNTETGNCIMFYAQDNYRIFKQKDIWSKEDEKMYKGINNTLNYYITKFRQTPSDLLADEIIKERNWFKSLKQRIIKYGISCD